MYGIPGTTCAVSATAAGGAAGEHEAGAGKGGFGHAAPVAIITTFGPNTLELIDGFVRGFVVEFEFAAAAVAAAVAPVAQMVGAGVLGAVGADFSGFRFANRTDKSAGCHFEFPLVFFGVAGAGV
jgi:hypothetical protein